MGEHGEEEKGRRGLSGLGDGKVCEKEGGCSKHADGIMKGSLRALSHQYESCRRCWRGDDACVAPPSNATRGWAGRERVKPHIDGRKQLWVY